MENGTSTISLKEISYPVYRIGKIKPQKVDNTILFYLLDTEGNTKIQIVDCKDVPGDTLAKRRLNLLANNVPLKKLSNAIFFMGDLVKLSASGIWFIDSMGNLFTHAKLNSSKLIFRKIVQKLPISTGGFIIEVEGIPTRFKCLHGPKPDEFYAGILEYKHTYVLYGFYKEEHKTTRRMV